MPIIIPLVAAAYVALQLGKKPGSVFNPNSYIPPGIKTTDAATTKKQLNFINCLNAVMTVYSAESKMGELGYVRFSDSENAFGVRQIYAPNNSLYDTPDGNGHVMLGNYTDMENYLLCVMQQFNRPNAWGYAGLPYSQERAIIRLYCSKPALNDAKNGIGPAGPHSTYLSSLLDHINLTQILNFIPKVVKAVSDYLSSHKSPSTDNLGQNNADYTDPSNFNDATGGNEG
jgi:hypothetical protein